MLLDEAVTAQVQPALFTEIKGTLPVLELKGLVRANRPRIPDAEVA
jgi:hypothetical protein